WEKRRKHPTTFSPTPEGETGRRGENIPQHFPRLPREKLEIIGILQWEKRRKHPSTFSPTPEGESLISGSS
ncbi:hypothetical protein L9F63_004859, partial [Diploptera punctata]